MITKNKLVKLLTRLEMDTRGQTFTITVKQWLDYLVETDQVEAIQRRGAISRVNRINKEDHWHTRDICITDEKRPSSRPPAKPTLAMNNGPVEINPTLRILTPHEWVAEITAARTA